MADQETDFAQKYAAISQWQFRRGLDLLELAAIPKGGMVVDLGCGTGALAIKLAEQVGTDGKVIAMDPDIDRLREAKTAANPAQLSFYPAKAENLDPIENGSVDLVFSNYAVHWVLDHAAMLAELERVFRPRGRFVTEFLGEAPSLLLELILLMPDGQRSARKNRFQSDADWRTLIGARDFSIRRFDWLDLSLDFDSLPDLYDWLEGTSNGGFQVAQMPNDALALYASKFPKAVSCPIKSVRMVLQRR